MENLTVPSCHKYIKTSSGQPDYQRIYSVTVSAFETKYPNETVNKDEILRYLKMNRIIPEQFDFAIINPDQIELCFTIISQFQCNSICQLCPYSTLYRNAHEKEETIILGYSLKTWENLQRIIKSGVKSRLFRAMIPVSEKSKVMVVPLNRLAFEYLETIPKSQEDMLSITDKIIALLRKNNQNKLSSSDFTIAKKYLDNLYNGNYSEIGIELLEKVLKETFNLSLQQKISVAHIDGFLNSGNSRPAPRIPEQKKETKLKEGQHISKPIGNQEIATKELQKNGHNKPMPKKQEILGTYTAETKKNKIEAMYPPWRLTQKALAERKTIFLNQADPYDEKLLGNDLLLSPLLPMEIIFIGNISAVLFLANNKLYCYDKSNPVILDLLLPYITASSYRKILCYEPYFLYEYFAKEQVYDVSICGLRLYFDIYEPLNNLRFCPAEALSKICRKNVREFPDILNLYKQTQLIFEKKSASNNELQHKKFHIMNRVSQILGYSEAFHASFCENPILNSFSANGYKFNYKSDTALKGDYIAITYFIHWKDETHFPVDELLSLLSDNIIFRKGIGVLSFDHDSIVLAVLPEYRDYLCDQINEVAYQIGKHHNKLPVTIDERS